MSATPPHSHSTASQVLAVARALFAEHGVDGVSMQDIATGAGVSKANVFHHFANKEALHIAVLRDCMGTPSLQVADLIASDAPFEQRFLALMQGKIADMLSDELGTRLIMRELSESSEERACHLAQQIFSEEIKGRLAFFADAKARGELREGVEPILADMLLGACCKFYFSHGRLCHTFGASIGHQSPATAEAFAQAVCSVLMHGMAAPIQPIQSKPAATSAKPARRSKALPSN